MDLEIELVPSSSWYNNVRSAVSTKEWDVIRKAAYARYDFKCGICKQKAKLEAHEIWEYDDEKHTQTLMGIIALCNLCHRVKHIGLSEILHTQGKLNIHTVIRHFCKVNKCDIETYNSHRNEAFAKHRERSQHPWEVDISWIKND